jgi:integrase
MPNAPPHRIATRTPSHTASGARSHIYASMLIRSGASVKAVQVRLGHSSAKTTLDVYGHLFPDEEDRTRRALEEAFADHEDETPTDAASDAE